MKRAKKRLPRLVGAGTTVPPDGRPRPLFPDALVLVRAAAPLVPSEVKRVKRCPICGNEPAKIDVTIANVTVTVGEKCSRVPHHLFGLWQAIRPFFL